MPRPSVLRRILGIALALLGIVLLAWSGWLYHFAAVADSTDETPAFWLAAGTFVLVLACSTLWLAVRYFRRGQRSGLP
jgi:hypothetical protein